MYMSQTSLVNRFKIVHKEMHTKENKSRRIRTEFKCRFFLSNAFTNEQLYSCSKNAIDAILAA